MAKGQRPPRKFGGQQDKRSKIEHEEIKTIGKIIDEQAPPRGTNPLAMSNPDRPTFAAARKFEDLPISRYTKDALKEEKFINLTAIQRAALPHALAGRDVLGAAKTGSGKTLAFLLPLIECLYRQKWGPLDGLGALVISPTRELALQIFEELRKVGKRHELSAGLLIGGKDVREEADCVAGLNILIVTPGRLLQHMDETPGFNMTSLQILVLDEADRILDMGFSATINAVIANLPRQRQTLLFSATQTKSVSALARLSLSSPEFVAAHADADAPTPVRLEQAYMECNLQDKLDIIWSFIRTHLKSRVIVFLSTCKQVRFVYEAFRRLRPGTPLRALHGRMSQYKRMGVYQQFCDSKASVLFATDVVARGLDFPSVDWVVQADCPEDVAAYIHRVGRTARYTHSGRGLLLLLPSEKEGMLAALEGAKIKIKCLKHNPEKLQPVTPALQALLSKDAEVKEIAQRALVSYLRSVFLQPKRAVFDVTKLPVEDFALSLGLPTVPKLRFLRRGVQPVARNQENGKGTTGSRDSDDDDEEEDEEDSAGGVPIVESKEHDAVGVDHDGDSDAGGDLLVVKRRHAFDAEDASKSHPLAAGHPQYEIASIGGPSKRKKRVRIDSNKTSGSRIVFDDDGAAVAPLELLARGGGSYERLTEEEEGGGGGERGAGLHTGVHATVADRATAAQMVMARRDADDKAAMRELRKAQRDVKRAKRLEREEAEGGAHPGAVLGPGVGGVYSNERSSSEYSEEREYDGGFGSARDDMETRAALLHSDSDDDGFGAPAEHLEVAHMGMAMKGPSITAKDPAEHKEKNKRKQKRGDNKGARREMSLAEQEALALHLLRSNE